MKKQTRHGLRILCGLGILLVLAMVLLPVVQDVAWVGSTDLTVEFTVTDADTGLPVEGAAIFVHDELNSRANSMPAKPRFVTDRAGLARETFPDQMTHGHRCYLTFTDTRSVRVPYWRVWVTAPGFSETEPVLITSYEKSVQRLGPREDRLVVPIALRKSRA